MGTFIRKLTAWNMADVAAWDNLRLASRNAARGKRRRPDVEDWLLREESEVLKLREELLSGSCQPGPYHFFTIREPKVREIATCSSVTCGSSFRALTMTSCVESWTA